MLNLEFDDATNKITDAYVFVKITYGSAWTYSENTFSGKINNTGTAKLTTKIETDNWTYLTSGNGYIVLVYTGTNSSNQITTGNLTDRNILDYSYPDASNTANKKTILVSNTLSETDCEWIQSHSSNFKLDFKAYAIQSEGFADASAAWAKVSQ